MMMMMMMVVVVVLEDRNKNVFDCQPVPEICEKRT